MQFDHTAGTLLWGIDHARIKRTGIDVQTDRAFPKMFRIYHAVHGICWIDRARMRQIHFHGFCRGKRTFAAFYILRDEVKIFHL